MSVNLEAKYQVNIDRLIDEKKQLQLEVREQGFSDGIDFATNVSSYKDLERILFELIRDCKSSNDNFCMSTEFTLSDPDFDLLRVMNDIDIPCIDSEELFSREYSSTMEWTSGVLAGFWYVWKKVDDATAD
jgi:hypothetical protein